MAKDESSSRGCGLGTALVISAVLAMATRSRGGIVIWFMVAIPVMTFYFLRFLRRSAKKRRPIKTDPNLTPLPETLTVDKIKTLMAEQKLPFVVPDLLNALESRKKSTQEAAYYALLKIKSPRAVAPLIEALQDRRVKIVDTAAEVLGEIGDAGAVPALVKLADSFNFHHRVTHYPHLEGALDKIRQNMLPGDADALCADCFLRYRKYYQKCKTGSNFNYYACRNCGGNAHRIPGVERVVLYMDTKLKEPYTCEQKNVYVNWLLLKKPFDFDEIVIKDASEEDIEEMVMILRNDMDDVRRKALSSKRLTIAGDLRLSPARRNLLQDNFINTL